MHALHVALHLSHLLHHCWIHAAAAATATRCHHLLHHSLLLHGGHRIHTSSRVASHRLHLLEVVLHVLPVDCCLSRCHVVASILTTLVLLFSIIAAKVAATSLLAPELVMSSSSTFAVTDVAPGLSTFDFDVLVVNFVVLGKDSIHGSITVEGHKTEPTRSTGVLVHHQRSIKDSTELLKELSEFDICALLANTADENLRCPFLFVTWNGALRVDLSHNLVLVCRIRLKLTNEFAIECMLFDHDDVDCFRIFECEESEAARPTSGAITHHLAVNDFAKLSEVVFE